MVMNIKALNINTKGSKNDILTVINPFKSIYFIVIRDISEFLRG